MASLVGMRGQYQTDRLYDASGTITTGGTAQLVLPRANTRNFLLISNPSSSVMYFEFGPARATATLTSGAVTSVSVSNAGLGYTRAPSVVFWGGALGASSSPQSIPTNTIQSSADLVAPSNPAKAHCVMTGSAGAMTVSSIVIDNPGSGYAFPPYVLLVNDPLDPFGAATVSANTGVPLVANGGTLLLDTYVPTDQISVFCATTNAAYTCKYSY